ncbi:MAG: phage Gp37/Gp68 family protein [Actinobacteria bacterium]|nr:phage Gp37/Gp68 family protein [Actinomycetota bacterium]
MSDKTGISWTDATWNPVVGCERTSPGCDHCYAIRDGVRLQHLPGYAGTIADGDWTGVVRCLPERLDQPLRWKRPRRIFVDSMSDLFHPDVPDAYIQAVIEVMAYAKQHTFQVLTKRPQRMAALLGYWHDRGWLLGKGAPGVGTLRPEVNHPTAKAGGLREGPSSPG